MIRPKLVLLLAERNLKITKVANDTGISRTTLTALVQNTSVGVQFETIDKLCRYLNITPTDFFEYIPLNIEIKLFLPDETYNKEIKDEYFLRPSFFELYLNINDEFSNKKSILYKGMIDRKEIKKEDAKDYILFEKLLTAYKKLDTGKIVIALNSDENNEEDVKILKNLPQIFLSDIENEIIKVVKERLHFTSILFEFNIDLLGERLRFEDK